MLVGAAAYWILDLDARLSILFGALLIVTGPTVVLPLLRHVQPVGRVRSILKWEGILNDPVGAIIAVLIFEGLFVMGLDAGLTAHTLVGLGRTVVVGGVFGSFGALALLVSLKRYWIPDFLQSVVSLTAVVVAFTASNLVEEESGLFTVTIMGLLLANQKRVSVRHIIEFKENLRVLLISCLFILLSARLEIGALEEFDLVGLAFLASLIFVVRPAAVFLSSIGSGLHWREKLFISWMAPRGVVAAAVASVFALRLDAIGYEGSERLVPLTFLVIIGTISIYGLTARPLAVRIGVARARPQGVLIIGAHRWARAVGEALHAHGVDVVLADTNRANVSRARMAGLRTCSDNVLSDYALEDLDLGGVGRVLALTSNDEANSLAALHFAEVFGSQETYQLAAVSESQRDAASASHLRGRVAFGPDVTFSALADRFFKGAVVKVTRLTEDFDHDSVRELYGDSLVPLFAITEKGGLRIFTADAKPTLDSGSKLVCLVDELEPTAQTVVD